MTYKHKILTMAVLLTALLGLLWSGWPAQALEKEGLQRGLRASVKLLILDPNLEVFGTCSGTVLNNQGYILTNFHCVGQTDIYGPDEEFGLAHGDLYHPKGILAVAMSDDPRQLPKPIYFAQYLAGNPDQDMAVIKIIADLDGNPVPDTLPLVSTVLVDSDLVDIGDEVDIIGYPSIGGDTVTFTEGKIAGFKDDDGNNVSDWFKTDALINGGNSGGTAVNAKGEMVGIPSAKKAVGIDQLYFIKPVNHAIPVIQRAMQAGGSGAEIGGSVDNNKGGGNIPTGSNIGELIFGTGPGQDGLAGVATTFPSGIAEVHAAMPYQDMRNGTSWGYVWFYEGQEIIGKTGLSWEEGESGVLNLTLSSDEGLPDGNFALQIIVNDKAVQEGQFVVGEANPIQNDAPQKPSAPQSEGVLLTGAIVDYDTGQPLDDALILFLLPGKTVADFDATEDMNEVVQSFAFTDANGLYITELPLPRGQVYTVIAGKEGYQRLALDDALEILPDDPDLIELEDVGLERR